MASSGHVNKVLGKVVETNNYSSDQPFQIVVQIDKQNALKLKQEQLPCFLSITRNNADTDSAEVHLILTVASLDHEPIKHGEETRIDTAHNQRHICPHEEINLLCSRTALEYYKIEPNEKVWVWVTPVYNADKVVLGAMTERAFRWANHQLFSTGLLVSLCQQPVLIQKGYILNPPVSEIYKNDEEFDLSMLKEITVLECSPNRQGVLCVKTEIIVLDMWKHEHLNVDIIKLCDTLNTGKALMVSDFANKRNVFSKCARSSLNGYTEAQSVKNPEQINLASLGVLFDFRQIKCALKNCKPKHDANSMIIVSYKVAKHFKLFNACYVKIQLTDTNDCKIHVRKSKESETALDDDGKKLKSYRTNPKGARFRIVQVNICPDAYLPNSTSQPAIVYCSSALYFHLAMGKRPTSKIYPTVIIQKLQTNKDEKDSSSTSWSSMLPFATELYLASINCPQYGPSAAIELAVLEYFNTTRLVQLGDVIPVITKGDAEFHQNLVEGCTQHQPVVYLKIKKIVPKMKPNQTFMADANHTCVFQDGATHSYVPSALSLTSSSLYCEDGVPPGLLAETETMVKTLLPYIENSRACEDLPASVLLHGPSGCGKTAVVSAVAAALHLHLYQVSCHELVGDTSAATEARLAFIMQKACNYSPCLLLLNGIHTLGYDRDGHTEDARVGSYFHRDAMKILKEDSEWPIVVVASTTSPKHLTAHMYEGFLHTQQIEPPNEAQRLDILRTLLVMKNCSLDVSIPHLAQRTAGFVLGDFLAMLASAFRAAYQRLYNMSSPSGRSLSPAEELSLCQGCALLPADFEEALSQLQGAHSDAIGAPKIPDVRWSDVGGLISVKTEILDTIQLPLQHPHLFASGMRRSGVLLYGPPGTGKTLLAKAVATECSLNFLSVKGPELINMYVGQSEENVREVFTRARSAAPCVIFFDELDSLAPNRGRSGDSGGVMDRVVSQLLAELDGLHKACDVFVIGATNRPDLLDPALLRPGRFDKLLYLSVSPDHASQLHIMQALTKRFELASDCCLERVIEDCPLNMTGADFYALCSDTMLQSMKRVIDALDAGAETNQNKVVVTEEDFMNALKCLVPSVSISELHRYQELHNHFTQK